MFSLVEIHRAFRQCRKGKRATMNALAFELNLEEELFALQESLNNRSYQPGRSIAFLVAKPKMREIFAADFRDRVVHHVLVRRLELGWERRFIHDSYACRQQKGTHAGVRRLQCFCRKVTANASRPAWYLQLDIRGFFMRINRRILFARLDRYFVNNDERWLTQTLLGHQYTENFQARRCRVSDFLKLPDHKTLFKAGADRGLPIGNLTSQFFANVYLDTMDQFVKRKLACRYYLRYCDDFILLHKDQGQLQSWRQSIVAFLRDELGLELNQRQRLRPVADGVDFLGYIVRPHYLLIRRRVVHGLVLRLSGAEQELLALGMDVEKGCYPWSLPLLDKIYGWLASYLGHFRHGACYRLIERLKKQFCWLGHYFICQPGRVIWQEKKAPAFMSFAAQCYWFKSHFSQPHLFLRCGSRWLILRGCFDGMKSAFSEQRAVRIRRALLKDRITSVWITETGAATGGQVLDRQLAWKTG